MRVKKLTWAFALLLGLAPLVLAPSGAYAVPTCACLDTNNDQSCAGEALLDSNDWLAGPFVGAGGNFPGQTFLLPAGCSVTVNTGPKGGIVVNAATVIVRGIFVSTPSGGEGVQFNATGDVFVDQVDPAALRPRIEAGGINKLVNNLANAAVAKSSVALKAGGTCTIINADLRGNPILASGQVGMQCNGDIEIHGSTVVAAGIDIQSLTGAIDAAATGGVLPAIGIECDVNVVDGGRNEHPGSGNNNGVLDAPDYPCTITFQAAGPPPALNLQILQFCLAEPAVIPNRFEAQNNPLVIIAEKDLRLDSPGFPGNFVGGRFAVHLWSETGKLDLDNAEVTNINSLGGARIWITATPTSATRFPVLKETWTGPSSGDIEINGTCFTSANKVQYGTGANVLGTPAAPPCKQFPADFTAVLNGP